MGAPLGPGAVRHLWARMQEIFGNRWTAQYGAPPAPGRTNPALATWARGLAGIGPRELELGLAKMVRRGDPWPPTLPAFRDLCRARPEDFGLPAPERALEEAVRARRSGGPWSHPAVRLAAEAAFARPWPTLTAREAAFRHAYRYLGRRVMAGAPLTPPPPDALGPAPEPAASPAEARRHLAALRALAGGPAARGGAEMPPWP